MTRLALLAALPLAFAVAAPAAAQDEAGDKVNMVDVYGTDTCPQSSAEVITVCRRLDEAERFRIPKELRDDPNAPKNEPWTDKVRAYETVGSSGIASCSPVGAGGATGCMAKMIEAAYKERGEDGSVRYGQLIEAARAERLATVDAEAAETQARVEQLEKEYEAKLARERAAEDGVDSSPPAILPPRK